ncbi:MAG: hypothetical protein L6R48_01910 [Planctomycetes bacterium]|nr:hypothetical protein [Planctomycetota bacterium]
MPMRTALVLLTAILAAAAEPALPAGWRLADATRPGGSATLLPDEVAPGGGPVVRLQAAAGSRVTVVAASLVLASPGAELAAELLVRSERPGRMLTVHVYGDPRPEGHWYQTRLLPLTAAWVRQRVTVAAPAGPEWAGRSVTLRLTVEDGEALVAGVGFAPATAPAAPPATAGNLLANPGFDAGGGGWFLQSWKPFRPGVPVRCAESPHGGRWALRLAAGGASVVSAAVPFAPGRPYTLSAHLRLTPGASASGNAARVFLITPTWRIAQTTVKAADLGAGWRRVSVTFRERDQGGTFANLVYARIDAEAAIDLDSLQLEPGEAAGAYVPGIQVGLEPPGTGACLAPGPAALEAVVLLPGGSAVPLGLELRALAADGGELFQRRLELPAGGDERRPLRIPVEHAREGVVACTLRVLAPDGAELARSEARYLVAGAVPAPNPLLGVDTLPVYTSLDLLRRSESLAVLLGLGYRRSFYHLHAGDGPEAGLERALPAYALQRAGARRNQVVIEPDEATCFHLGRMQKAGAPPDDAAFAADIPRYVARFCAVAGALAGQVDEVELLNEPNIWGVKGRHGMPPARYVQLLQAVRPALRAAVPGMRLAVQINGVDTAWLGQVAELGGLAQADLVTFHAYRANPEHPPLVDDLARLRALVDRYAPGMPLANSEQYYGLLGHGIPQGEWDRNYCGEDETDISARLLQSALHGLTVGAPFALLTPGSGLWRDTPFDAPWWFQAAGGLRALARLTAGVVDGRDLPVHDAVRALLLRRADGSHLVTLNARLHGERGTIARPSGCTVTDSDGNPLAGDPLAVASLPVLLDFPPGLSTAAVAAAVQGLAVEGFAFPLALAAVRAADGAVVEARNRERRPLQAQVRWSDAGAPAPWSVALPAAGSATAVLPGTGLRWQDDPALGYEVAVGPEQDAGRLRIPVLLIPRVPADAAWQPTEWLELGEERLSTDFAPARPHRGPADLAARVALGWNQAGLQLLAQVADDAVVPGPNTGGNAWAHDSLQLYVDQRAAARGPRALTDSACTAWILGCADAGGGFAWLDLAPAGRFVGAANATSGLDPLPLVDWRRTAGGWECRASFPPAALPQVELRPGHVLGLSLLINDDDGQGRKQGLTLGPAGSEPHGRPWLWKRCQLAP